MKNQSKEKQDKKTTPINAEASASPEVGRKSAKEKNAPDIVEGNRIRMQFDISYRGSKGKVMNPESDTIPEMSLTVRQLLENHTRGKDSNVEVRQPLYFEVPVPTINDITDVDRYREQLETALKQTEEFLKNEKENAQTESPEKDAPKSGENNSGVSKKTAPETEQKVVN